MVTMVGEIDLDRYARLPPLYVTLRSVYQEQIGEPPANRPEDLALAAMQEGPRRGPSPHPTRARKPRSDE